MIIEIKVPSPGESISEVEIARWLVNDGDYVEKDQEIAEIESDKATLPLIASENGEIKILKSTGIEIATGEVVCHIDTSKKGNKKKVMKKTEIDNEKISNKTVPEKKPETKELEQEKDIEGTIIKITPVAQQMMEENNLSTEDIIKGLKKITSKDVHAVLNASFRNPEIKPSIKDVNRDEDRSRMSVLRRKLGQRLVSVKNETAMLTTFNEVDMSNIMEIRKKFQETFIKKHDVKLGLMSFFAKAVSIALKSFPMVNSIIDGEDIVTPKYTDIGIAVQTDKGLMVPVLRNVEIMGLAEIEKEILKLAEKARTNKISIEEMTGGTFTISNGGIYGSMLSTPILNPPQSAILGMHSILNRPVALNDMVVIRPMMYLALSYDHRIIDGRDSVSFLMKVKEMIENPYKMLFDGSDSEKILLNI